MGYVSPRQASKTLGVSTRTLSRWADEGKIPFVKTAAGQRRYDLTSYLKQQSPVTTSTVRTVLYARVSTHGQRDDLTRQTEALTRHYPHGEVITEVGSGLNLRRRKFITLLERVIRGDIDCMVVAHKDRLCRFGFELVEWLCEQFECQLVVLYKKNCSPHDELVQDMLSVVHCFSARLYGLRKYEKKLREDPELQSQNATRENEGSDETESERSSKSEDLP